MMFLFSVQKTAAQTETFTTDQCSNPTQDVTVTTIDTGGVLGFNASTAQITKGACVRLALKNPSHNDHDFDISATENPGMTTVHTEFAQNDTVVYLNVQFPNKDMDVVYFCGVTGHRAAGMVGTFIVGKGKSSGFLPGFELPVAIVAFLSMIAIPQIRKFKK